MADNLRSAQKSQLSLNKGIRLGQLGKSEEEIKVYNELIKEYGQDKEAGIREQFANALNSKEFDYILNIKQSWEQPNVQSNL